MIEWVVVVLVRNGLEHLSTCDGSGRECRCETSLLTVCARLLSGRGEGEGERASERDPTSRDGGGGWAGGLERRCARSRLGAAGSVREGRDRG